MSERCEGGLPGCGPVEHHDADGVPLCSGCWQSLLSEPKDCFECREEGRAEAEEELAALRVEVERITAERDALQQQVAEMVAPEELRQWKAEAERLQALVRELEGKALAYDDINERGEECWNYCQQYTEGRFGRNIWHVALEDAIRLRKREKQP